VTSHRLKRSMRGALTATAVVAMAVGFTSLPASADPASPPPPSGSPLQQYQQLSQQASDLNNKLQSAQVDLQNKQKQLNQANAALASAKTAETAAQNQENLFRDQVDQLTAASFEGAQFNQFSALLTGNSTQDFLDKATALSDMATDNANALNKLAAATNAASAAQAKATSAQKQSQDATNAAAALVSSIQQQQTALNIKVKAAQTAYDKLSGNALSSVKDTGIQGTFIAPPGVAGEAMNEALSKRGSEYVWGGSGPTTFDCSGLVMWAYAREGVSLPHSSAAQSQMGELISSRSALQPGDLVFFGTSGHIHHVGIYVGGGDMVDAPDTGDVVKVQPLNSDYAWGRRLG
jgi:cell wall-associated NlpC family hydrolase